MGAGTGRGLARHLDRRARAAAHRRDHQGQGRRRLRRVDAEPGPDPSAHPARHGQGRGRRAELLDHRHRRLLRRQVGRRAEGLGRPVEPGRGPAAGAHRRQARHTVCRRDRGPRRRLGRHHRHAQCGLAAAGHARAHRSREHRRDPGSAGPAGPRPGGPPVHPPGADGAVHHAGQRGDLRRRARRRWQEHCRNMERPRLQGPADVHLARGADLWTRPATDAQAAVLLSHRRGVRGQRAGREARRDPDLASRQGTLSRRGHDHRFGRPGPRRDHPRPQAVRRDRRPADPRRHRCAANGRPRLRQVDRQFRDRDRRRFRRRHGRRLGRDQPALAVADQADAPGRTSMPSASA